MQKNEKRYNNIYKGRYKKKRGCLTRYNEICRYKILLYVVLTLFLLVFMYPFSSNAKTMEGNKENKYYTRILIERGDTLWSISGNYMDYNYYKNRSEFIQELKVINSLDSNKIISGNYIIVP